MLCEPLLFHLLSFNLNIQNGSIFAINSFNLNAPSNSSLYDFYMVRNDPISVLPVMKNVLTVYWTIWSKQRNLELTIKWLFFTPLPLSIEKIAWYKHSISCMTTLTISVLSPDFWRLSGQRRVTRYWEDWLHFYKTVQHSNLFNENSITISCYYSPIQFSLLIHFYYGFNSHNVAITVLAKMARGLP